MVNHGEKWLEACDSVFLLLEKDKIDCLKSLKLNFVFFLKCFEAVRVNICMVNRWFTIVYCRVIHRNGQIEI